LWGDSFAAHLAPGLVRNSGNFDANVIQFTTSGCPPIFGFETPSNKDCVRFNETARDVIAKSNADTVVLSARWTYYLYAEDPKLKNLQETISWIISQGKNVVVIGQTPNFEFARPDDFYRTTKSDRAEVAPVDYLTAGIRAHSVGASVIDPFPFFCERTTCRIMDNRGNYWFWDSGHLSAAGSTYLIGRITEALNRAGGRRVGR
jgi:hypothetical protein